jgi:hypothetical protein
MTTPAHRDFVNEPDQTGLGYREVQRIAGLMKQHAEALRECRNGLVTNFDVPAQRTINFMLAKTGMSRIDYEKIQAVENNWPYEKPSEKLLRRWATY